MKRKALIDVANAARIYLSHSEPCCAGLLGGTIEHAVQAEKMLQDALARLDELRRVK